MFLGIDAGTQGTKALIVGDDGQPLGRGYATHRLIQSDSGAREQEPSWWIDSMRSAVRQALGSSRKSSSLLALSVGAQQHGLVTLDKDLRVIRPAKLWNDTETASANEELIRRIGGEEACIRLLGLMPLTGYTVSKLMWMALHEPQNFSRIRHILLPHEYMNFWLTGVMKAEYGDASGTGYFNVRDRRWEREVLDVIDGGSGQLFAALPPLMAADETVGTLTPRAAISLDLPETCLVAAGGGDNMMSAIGTGNIREGVVTLSLGTSSTIYSFKQEPLSDPSAGIAPFCSSSGGWLPLVCTMNATSVVTATAQLLGRTVEDIDSALDQTNPGADGITFLPFLNGERTPDLPNARGSIYGLSATNFTWANLLRAAVEGVSFGILEGSDLILESGAATVLQLIGGGARSRWWRQLFADATGSTIEVPIEEESGCLGAAIQAAVAYSKCTQGQESFETVADRFVRSAEGSGCLPRTEFRQAYDAARERYRSLLASYVKSATIS